MAKKKQGVSKKADAAKKKRILEDKTFGMKNKKGAKGRKFVAQVKQQLSHQHQQRRGGVSDETAKLLRRKEKKLKEKEERLMANLFASDNKKKAAKLKAKQEQDKNGVVKKKKKKKKKGAPPPPKEVDNRPIAVKVEEQRAALVAKSGASLTPVTEATFLKWKKKIAARKKKADDAARKAWEKESGRKLNKSGRELYGKNSKNFVEAAGAGGIETYAGGKKGLLDIEAEEEARLKGNPPVPPSTGDIGAIDSSLYLNEDLAGLDDLDISDDGD